MYEIPTAHASEHSPPRSESLASLRLAKKRCRFMIDQGVTCLGHMLASDNERICGRYRVGMAAAMSGVAVVTKMRSAKRISATVLDLLDWRCLTRTLRHYHHQILPRGRPSTRPTAGCPLCYTLPTHIRVGLMRVKDKCPPRPAPTYTRAGMPTARSTRYCGNPVSRCTAAHACTARAHACTM